MKMSRMKIPVMCAAILLGSIVTAVFADLMLRRLSDNAIPLQMNSSGQCIFPNNYSPGSTYVYNNYEWHFRYTGTGYNPAMWTSVVGGLRMVNIHGTLDHTIPAILNGHLVIKQKSSNEVLGALSNDGNFHIKGDLSTHAYYLDVSTSNNGTNAGTLANPWKTLDDLHFLNPSNRTNPRIYQPGDIIFIKRGTVINLSNSTLTVKDVGSGLCGLLTPQGNGTVGTPITIDAYGIGPKPVIDAQGVDKSAAILLYNQSYWTIQNMEVRNDVAVHDFASQRSRWGILAYYDTYNSNTTMTDPPITPTTSCGIYNGITIRDNIVRNVFGTYTYTSPIRDPLKPAADNYWFDYIIPNTFMGCGGISISTNSATWYSVNDVLIENNYVENCTSDGIHFIAGYIVEACWSHNVVIRNNNIKKTAQGIFFGGTKDVLIEKNVVDSSGFGIWNCCVHGGTVQYNELKNSFSNLYDQHWDGGALDADLGLDGIIIYQYNYSHNNQGLFIETCATPGTPPQLGAKVIVRYNVSQNDGGRDWYDGLGSCSPLIFPYMGVTYVYNNTFYTTGRIQFYGSGAYPLTNLNGNYFWNNTFCGHNNVSSDWSHSGILYNVFDHNCFYPVNGTLTAPDGATYSIQGDPLISHMGTAGDGFASAQCYKLQSGSPCINWGTIPDGDPIPATGYPGSDFWGNALFYPYQVPDIGAYEQPATTYTLTVVDAIGNSMAFPVAPGEVVPIRANVNDDDFTGSWSWTSGATITNQYLPTTTVTLINSATVTASFSHKPCQLTIDAPNGGGSVAPLYSGPGGSAITTMNVWRNSGDVVMIAAYPDSAHVFLNWSGSDIANSSSALTTVTLSGNSTVHAYFQSKSNVLTVQPSVPVTGPVTGGVFSATNPSGVWSPVVGGSANMANTNVYALVSDGTTLYAGTNGGGVFKSPVSPINWTAINTVNLTNLEIRSLVLNGTTLYAGTNGGEGVFSTSTGTINWAPKNINLSNHDVRSLAMYSGNLYAGTNGGGVFRFDGPSWTDVNDASLVNTNILCLKVFGSSSNLYAGTSGGGVYCYNGSGWTASKVNLVVRSFAVNGTTALYAGTNGGVYMYSFDGTSWNWTAVNTGLPTNTVVYSLEVSGSNLVAGTDAGIFYTPISSISWIKGNTATDDLSATSVLALVAANGKLYAGTNGGGYVTPTSRQGNPGTIFIAAVADIDYTFNGWTGVTSSNLPATTVTLSADATAQATFTRKSFRLTVGANDNTFGSVSQTQRWGNAGENITLTAAPDENHKFSIWSMTGNIQFATVDGITYDNSTATTIVQLTGSGPNTATASFQQKPYHLTVYVINPSSGSVYPVSRYGNAGETITVTAFPVDGHSVSWGNITGGASYVGTTNPNVINVTFFPDSHTPPPSNATVTATFN
jgi:hypothetical protein